MIHSVWDWDRLRYDYYRSPRYASVGGWKPLTGLGIPATPKKQVPVGVDIEDVLPVLPPDAVLIGHGVQAAGQVCRRPKPGTPVSGITDMPDEHRKLLQSFLFGMGAGALIGKFSFITIGGLTLGALLLGLGANGSSK